MVDPWVSAVEGNSGGAAEEAAHVVVGDEGELFVGFTDGSRGVRSPEAVDSGPAVRSARQMDCAEGRGEHDALDALLAHGGGGGGGASLAPVATPSSTTMTVRPAMGMDGSPMRQANSRRRSSAAWIWATWSKTSRVIRNCSRMPGFMTQMSPEAMAPMARSGWPGTPSFRTTQTPRGAWRARATA